MLKWELWKRAKGKSINFWLTTVPQKRRRLCLSCLFSKAKPLESLTTQDTQQLRIQITLGNSTLYWHAIGKSWQVSTAESFDVRFHILTLPQSMPPTTKNYFFKKIHLLCRGSLLTRYKLYLGNWTKQLYSNRTHLWGRRGGSQRHHLSSNITNNILLAFKFDLTQKYSASKSRHY